MDINTFQDFSVEMWFGDSEGANFLAVPALGVAGEAGEVADKIKKMLRGDEVSRESIGLEMSDVLFYVAVLADRLGFSMTEIAQMQVDKINGRIERDTRRGDGDNR